MSRDILEQIDGRAPRRVLEELAAVGRALAKADRNRPEVELALTSGSMIRGRIVNVVDEHGVAIATLHVGGPPVSPSVTFVRIDQIAAVTIIDATQLVRAPQPDDGGTAP